MRERLISVPERSRVFVIIKKFAQTLGVFFLRKPALQRIAQLGEVAVSALELLELAELLFCHVPERYLLAGRPIRGGSCQI